ncbi:hypothetical protein [Acidovorax sp. PRC11]|uniref:hypothetical protein n=1 Tax=Acidovorax sp. PRC11 TaxID=2962592 RepID=UPI0028814B9B|nr:hypothetical protein [Acidovorax sp. PRC11]MDT0136412.1 hypothetical protein [Acidovorax sp. PRC11]
MAAASGVRSPRYFLALLRLAYRPMCMELLGRLARSELPLTEADPDVLDRLRVLEAAGHIRVLIPSAHLDCGDCLRQDAVTVLEILPAGWRALSTGAPDEEACPLSSPRPRRPKLARIADWLSSTRRRSGE